VILLLVYSARTRPRRYAGTLISLKIQSIIQQVTSKRLQWHSEAGLPHPVRAQELGPSLKNFVPLGGTQLYQYSLAILLKFVLDENCVRVNEPCKESLGLIPLLSQNKRLKKLVLHDKSG